MKRKKVKALLSKTVALGIAASMTMGMPVMADENDLTADSLISQVGGVNPSSEGNEEKENSPSEDSKSSTEGVSQSSDGEISESSQTEQFAGKTPATKSGHSVVRRVIISDKTPRITYRFHYDDHVATQIVKDGDVLYEPSVPQAPDGKTFLGWYEKNGETYTSQFTGFGSAQSDIKESKTVDLYPRFSEDVYILYYDQKGDLIESQKVGTDGKVNIEPDSPIVEPNSKTQAQVGWHKEGETQDFTGNQTVTDTIKLYPTFKEGNWVTFDTDNGTAINREFIPADAAGDAKKAKEPETKPVKKGYTFIGWYTSKEEDGQKYNFDRDVQGPLTLYAHFTPNEDTEYKVEYYIEYESALGNDVNDGTWGYKLLTEESRKGKTGDEAQYDPDYIFKAPYGKSRNAYELDQEKTKNTIIDADGTTVYKIYYKCKAYPLSITFPDREGKNRTLQYEDVKYSTDLTNFWKKVYDITPKEKLFDGKHTFFWWYDELNYGAIVDDSEFNAMESFAANLQWSEEWNYDFYYNLYFETLHGEAPQGKKIENNHSLRSQGDNRTYYLLADRKIIDWQTWAESVPISQDEFPGFTFLPESSDGHYAPALYGNGYEVFFGHGCDDNEYETYYPIIDGDESDDEGWHRYIGPDRPLNLYFKRNSYNLSFHTDGGPSLKNSSQSVLFEDDLKQFNPSSYVIGQTKKVSGNQEFVFDGWYTDAALTEPFNLNTEKMPARNVDFYAKWKPKTYTITFDSNGGSATSSVTGLTYGSPVPKPVDPTYARHIFQGWTLNGKPYHFENGVNDDITLTAAWRSEKSYGVRYDLNGGTGKTPTDNGQYYENVGVPVASYDGVTAPEGKVFLGWKSSKDGKIYYPGGRAPMGMPASDDEADGLTLTAQWGDQDKTTKLTYDYNFDQFGIQTDGDQRRTVDQIRNNSSVELSDLAALGRSVPSGWQFAGWYLDKACSKPIDENQVLVDREDEDTANIVYAKWEKVQTPDPEPAPQPVPNPVPDPKPIPETKPSQENNSSHDSYNSDVHPEVPKNDPGNKDDGKNGNGKNQTSGNKMNSNPDGVQQTSETKKQNAANSAATTSASTAKASATKISRAKTADDVETADEGHAGRSAAAMTLSAVMMGIAAVFTRKRKHKHNR